MSNLFSTANNVLIPAGETAKPVTVKLGTNGKTRAFLLIDEAGGKQPFRTQYDLALDGSEYLLAAGKGAGDYTFILFEGPIVNCAGNDQPAESFFNSFKTLKKAADRRIVITTSTKVGSTQGSAEFKGYVTNVQIVTISDKDGRIMTKVVISSIGRWS